MTKLKTNLWKHITGQLPTAINWPTKVLMKPNPAAARTHSKTRLPAGPRGLIRLAPKIDIVPVNSWQGRALRISKLNMLKAWQIAEQDQCQWVVILKIFQHQDACKHKDRAPENKFIGSKLVQEFDDQRHKRKKESSCNHGLTRCVICNDKFIISPDPCEQQQQAQNKWESARERRRARRSTTCNQWFKRHYITEN